MHAPSRQDDPSGQRTSKVDGTLVSDYFFTPEASTQFLPLGRSGLNPPTSTELDFCKLSCWAPIHFRGASPLGLFTMAHVFKSTLIARLFRAQGQTEIPERATPTTARPVTWHHTVQSSSWSPIWMRQNPLPRRQRAHGVASVRSA